MDSQDHIRNHTLAPGHESHGVHVCHKCGWPFPNPHPSAKHRRAHKRICGTIEGYKLSDPEGQAHLNTSDDEHLSDDDDHKLPSSSKKGNGGIGEKLSRSEDEVFSDAVADFPDSGLSLGTEEHLRDGLDSETNVERVDRKDPKFQESSEEKGFDAADVSKLTFKSGDDRQMQNPKVLQREGTEVGNTQVVQDQLSDSTEDPSSNFISGLMTDRLAVVHSGDCIDLSSDSHTSGAEAMSDVSVENKMYDCENVTDCSLTYVAKNIYLEGKDEIESDRDMAEIAVSSNNSVGEVPDRLTKIEVSDMVSLDHKLADGAVALKEKNNAEFPFVLPQDDLPLEADSAVSTNDSTNIVLVESAQVLKIPASSDLVKSMQEMEEGNVDVYTFSTSDVVYPKSEFEYFKDHEGVVIQNTVSPHSAEAVKSEKDDFKETITEEYHSNYNLSQLSEEKVVLSPDIHVLDDSIELEQTICEPMVKEMLAEEQAEVSPVNLTVDGNQRSDDTGATVDSSQMNESHMLHLSGEPESDDIHKISQQINLQKCSVIISPDKFEDCKDHEGVLSQTPLSLCLSEMLKHEEDFLKDTVTEGSHSIICPSQLDEESVVLSLYMHVLNDSINQELVNNEVEEIHSEEQAEVSKVEPNVEDDQISDEIGSSVNAIKTEMDGCHMVHLSQETYQPSDHLQMEVKPRSGVFKSDGASEAGKIENVDITDTQCKEVPIVKDMSLPKSDSIHFGSPNVSEDVTGGSSHVQCMDVGILSGTKEALKEVEFNNNSKVLEECDRPVGTVANFHQARVVELFAKAPEDHARKYSLVSPLYTEDSARHFPAEDSSLSTEYSAQCVSSAEDKQAGESGGDVPGISAMPVQDHSGHNLVKQQLGSSRIDTSVDSGSRCDSLEGNWGSVSVLSVQSDAPIVTDAEALPSTNLLGSNKSEKSSFNNLKSVSEGQQSEKSEMFEPPSFMTLVEPGHLVDPKATGSDAQKGQNPQPPNSTSSQAGWFPTLTQVVNESQGRKKNEEKIAKVTNWSTSKQHTPLKSLLGEAAHSDKPKSPKLEENPVNHKNGKVPKDNDSGLTTVNSILGPESPAAQVVKGDAGEEWNSPATYPADIKREKKKVRSRPYWIQFVCCSFVDPQRR